MAEAVEQLISQASTLSERERAELAYFVLSALEPEDKGTQREWRTEIARRVPEIRAGSAVGRSADEVLGELRERCFERAPERLYVQVNGRGSSQGTSRRMSSLKLRRAGSSNWLRNW
jgi:hypothetical protein